MSVDLLKELEALLNRKVERVEKDYTQPIPLNPEGSAANDRFFKMQEYAKAQALRAKAMGKEAQADLDEAHGNWVRAIHRLYPDRPSDVFKITETLPGLHEIRWVMPEALAREKESGPRKPDWVDELSKGE